MSPTDQATAPPPPGSEDDIIELTEVVDDAPAEVAEDATAEVVLDFRSGGGDMESLKSPIKPQDEKPAIPRQPLARSLWMTSWHPFPTSPRTWTSPQKRPPRKLRQPRTCAKSWRSA